MWVKICGTTNREDAELAVRLGADALGFIFAPSKRRVGVEEVAGMIAALPAEVERVGVFTEGDVEEIARAVEGAGLTAVQLHLAHDAGLTARLKERLDGAVKLIQVIQFETHLEDAAAIREQFGRPLREALGDEALWAVLLDAAKGGASGGLGEAFSWERARPVVREAVREAEIRSGQRPRVLLAGGLRAENVREAVAMLEPWGVDVVSGVEARPGRKDPDRLARFIASAGEKSGRGERLEQTTEP